MARRVYIAFLIAFLVFGLVACGDDGTGVEAILGTYALQSVGGEELPAEVDDPAAVLAFVIEGSLTLNENKTCSSSFTTRRELANGDVTTTTDPGVCTYTFTDEVLRLVFPSGTSSTNGSISDSTISVTLGSTVYVFVFEM